MKRTLLLTGFDDYFAPLGKLTTPIMLDYANRHGMDFLCVRTYPKDEPAYWHKMPRIVQAFREGYERVLWLDADQLITNANCVPPSERGFHASQDWGVDATGLEHFSMCGFVAGREVGWIFEHVLNEKEKWIDQPFPEQAPMRWLYQTQVNAREMMTIHPRGIFNSVPIEVHPSVVRPWKKGDWLCHLTMLPIEERVKLFHKIHG